MSKRYFAALAALAVMAQGCAPLGRTARINPSAAAARSIPTGQNRCPLTSSLAGDNPWAIDLTCFKFDSESDRTAYWYAVRNREARNRLEAVLLSHADDICLNEMGRIYANRAMTNATLDFLSAGLSGASTIVGGEQAKSILSGLAGLSTATRANIEANVYQNQLVPAITKVMDVERGRILDQLKGRRPNETQDYPADEMIRMVNEYHRACSFEKGIQLLLDAAVNQEGYQAIVKDINLRAAEQTLQRQIGEAAARAQRGESGATETRSQLELRLREIQLQRSANIQSANTTTPPAAGN